ncbi:TonB-dependent receptor [Rhabdobacter roseus]|uniref:TonB-dependent receptor plug domain-containing protein n=1 Tax=Rhabdobacter roseus TaxID=1655419 RepID=A0A840TZF0_9BACT|nr:TonB-dependent receptor [Rhabdobacter roseus]MBB5287002.1 hypothetical protein [Rhabdobacter roseus]
MCFALSVSAQNVTVSGYIRDAASGESLIGATVYNTNHKSGTVSNNYGFYSLTLPAADTLGLVFSMLGYEPKVKKVATAGNLSLTVNLSESARQLAEVTVSTTRNDDNVSAPQMGVIDVPIKQIKTLPAVLGERDVLKIIQLLPGVQSGQEGTTGFFVRGGNTDQNLVQLDEATVYNPNHLFGLFSTFNTNALKNVTLIKGGFPAQYGGRLSSILDITMKDGNNRKTAVTGGIGLLTSNITVEGAIKKEKSSYIVSARRSYADLIAKPFLGSTSYYFYDLNAKFNFWLGQRDRLFLSGFTGKDKAAYTGANSLNYGIDFGNSTATVRWNHQFSSKLFANTSLIYNSYHLSLSTIQNKYFAQIYSGIQDLNAKVDVEYYAGSRHKLSGGANYTDNTFFPATSSAKIPKSGVVKSVKPDSIVRQYSNILAFYASDEIKVSDRLSLNAGLRIPIFTRLGKRYTFLEPRLNVKYGLDATTSLKAAYTEMNQFIHLVPSSTASLPTDIWISSSPKVRPQNSRQVALGVFKNFKENAYETSVEVYYKTMHNQVLFREGTQPLLTNDIETTLVFGKGNSYGVEFFVRKNEGKLTGWVSYTLSKTTQQFDSLNFGNPFPFRYDKRHNLSVAGSYELNPKWTFSATFVFTSGGAFTLPVGRIPVFQDGSLYDGIYSDYTARNNYRLRPYNRLDVSAILHQPQRHLFQKRYDAEWIFGIYNVYSRRNPYFVYLATDPITKQPAAKQVSLLPIIPSVSYNFKF